jgi:hypothetical protein
LQVLTERDRRERLDGNKTGNVLLGMLRQERENQSHNCSDGGSNSPGANNGLVNPDHSRGSLAAAECPQDRGDNGGF